ncbi:Anti-repressor SinI [Neobacillus massiliamazoniensis]|uniref:Anti-repressor SinI n=1 Tax=Neobacillus massiliamazoniensis TaxID=1499688 RepID=A0A0U1NV40_9BACI|nr:Anti-repressor SinI [Neobacillus massiliamazoniensis]
MAYQFKRFVSFETTEKGKPFEKKGRKATDLRHSTRSYDGRAAWDTKTYFRGNFNMKTTNGIDGLDLEWLALIIEAMELGISKETVRDYLHTSQSTECLMEKP